MKVEALLVAALLALTSCTTYEYEDEVFLNVDGSGSLRISGSRALLRAIDEIFEDDLDAIGSALAEPAFGLDSVRETRRDAGLRIVEHDRARKMKTERDRSVRRDTLR